MIDINKIKSKLTLVLDDINTIADEKLSFNLLNVNKQSDVFECDPAKLTFYVSGSKVDVLITKDQNLHNGLRIRVLKDLSSIEWISWMVALKDDDFAISPDDGKKVYITKLNVGKSSDDNAHEKMLEKISKVSNKLVQQFWSKLEGSQKNAMFNLKNSYEELGGVISFVNEEHSTSTSLRLQLVFPKDHPRRAMFKPEEIPTKFYYHFDGYLYEIKTKLVQGVGDFFEWDLTGLEPGTSYVGLSFSTDGGNSILPSSSLFGVTRDQSGRLLNIDEAPIAKPFEEAGYAKYKMWNEEMSLKFIGKDLNKIMYDVMVKKQYEFDNDGLYAPLINIDEFYPEYPWIKKGKDIE